MAMILDLRDIFAGGKDIDINADLTPIDYEINGENPISESRFVGTVRNRAGVIELCGKANFIYSAPCDRCAQPVSRDFSVDIFHVIVSELSNAQDADDEIVVVDNMQLDLSELVRSDVILNLPAKFLCKPDCKGICPGCGKRLNFEKCVCKQEIDPRLAKLSEFFDDEN